MIRKYQIGATVNYISSVNPNKIPQDVTSSSKKKKKSDDDEKELIDKSLLKEFYTKGIPVDVDEIANDIALLQEKQDVGIKVSATELNQLRAKINRVVKTSEYFDKAKTQAADNDALGEIAVTDRGELFVFDQDAQKIKKVSKHDFNAEEQVALTVGELIRARENTPSQAFDTASIQAIGSSVGMSVISDRIKTILDIVGNSTSTSEAYTDLASYVGANNAKRPTQAEYEALQIMSTAIGNGALDQGTIYRISKEVGQKNVEAAFNYIIRVLPRNMQEQLQGRLVAQGLSVEDARNELKNTVLTAIAAHDETTDNFKIQVAPENMQRSPASSPSSKTFYQTVNEAIFDPQLNAAKIDLRSRLGTDDSNSNIQLKVQGNWWESPLTENKTNTPIPKSPLSVAIDKTVTQYIDKNHMFAGTQKINQFDLTKMLYTGDGQGIAWMPVKSNGDINWEQYKGCEKAENIIKERGYVTDEDKNKVHAECNSFCRYVNGEMKARGPVDKYYLTYAYALDDEIDEDINSMAEPITGDEEDKIEDLYDQIFDNKDAQEKYGFDNHRRFYDDIYKVPVFFKVNESAPFDVYRYNGHGSLMTPKTLDEDMLQQEQQRRVTHPVIDANADYAYQE